MNIFPEGYENLLEKPFYGHLATTRPDSTPQVNPMWFTWDGELIRFTNTSKRQKCKNIQAEPTFAIPVTDPYRYLEVRGTLVGDPLRPRREVLPRACEQVRATVTELPADADDRVVIVVRPTKMSQQ